MRYIQEVIWDNEELSSGINVSPSFDVRMCYIGSYQLTYPLNTVGGVVKLQASLDGVTWTDIPNTECALGQASDTILWNLAEIYYPYTRIYLQAYESLDPVSCRIFMKGGG